MKKMPPLRTISLADAAIDLEDLCDNIDSGIDIDDAVKELFAKSTESFEEAVDRRLRYLWYLDSQVIMAKELQETWAYRADSLMALRDRLTEQTLATVKSFDRPFRGTLGELKAQKNSIPRLIIDHECLPGYLVEQSITSIDRDKLKKDLLAGREVPGARLEYGEHLRIGKGIA